jgi:hypothetical protein
MNQANGCNKILNYFLIKIQGKARSQRLYYFSILPVLFPQNEAMNDL